ncbi:MAG: penicillin acylase family protein [Rhodospirillales bacterium]|nr:penicillin acylase family protein [Rhodospirillales bacterium]
MSRSLFARGSAALAVAAAIGIGLGALWFSASLPPRNDRVAAAIGAPVAVYRDPHGVPHIFADTAADAAFALGYVHAQDRLWQMEGTRRLGAGRLSELFGPATIETDRFMRTLGFARLAEAQYETSSAEVRAMLDAYARGVNRWRESHQGALPPEFAATGLAPEPWRPADSLLWFRTMSLRLAGNRNEELLREGLGRLLPPDMLADLWPPAPPGDPLTIPGASSAAGAAGSSHGPGHDPGGGRAELGGASNFWVVGGSRTKSGKPLLANDPHLRLGAPGPWYLARVVTPAGSLAGATAPGVPFFIFGHNDRIAWGLTNTGSDVEDLFLERPDPEDPGRYLTPSGSEPFALRSETIKVKGGGDVTVAIRSTRHGPVVSDIRPEARPVVGSGGDASPEPGGGQEILALAATYLADDDATPETALGVNAAGSWPAFVAALSRQKIVQQNFAYADVDGNIGFIVPGRVPIREPGQGLTPAPGWSGEADWRGFVPFSALPRVFNPPVDLIINANNRVVDDSYPWYLGADWDPGFRAQRIAELLIARSHHTVASMAAIQNDIASPMAKTLLPLMLAAMPAGSGHADVVARLRDWSADAEMAADRPEPLIFAAWLRALTRALGEDRLGGLFAAYWGYRPLFVERVLRDRPVWCDRPLTPEVEDCGARLDQSLSAAMAELAAAYGDDWRSWRWAAAHEARFDNLLLGRIPLIRSLVNVRAPVGGGNDTIMRAASDIADLDGPFAAIHGAGYRAVYDLADPARSRFIVVPGQSGNPLSLHYRDLVGPWLDGRSITLGQSRAELEAEATSRLTLVPEADRH